MLLVPKITSKTVQLHHVLTQILCCIALPVFFFSLVDDDPKGQTSSSDCDSDSKLNFL